MSEVWKSDLPSNEKFVLLALADFAGDDGECWPSVPRIAKNCSICDRAAYNILNRLLKKGFITKMCIQGIKNVYHIYPQPLNEVHPCTTFTPARRSDTPESRYNSPLNLDTIPYIEPSVNHQLTINESGTIKNDRSEPEAYGGEKIKIKKEKIIFNFASEKFDHLSDSKIDLWAKAYPKIDVREEIRKAACWLLANPKNKKSNYERFLVNWLARTQDSARATGTPGRMDRAGRKHDINELPTMEEYREAARKNGQVV
jgi:hypothetical protein